MVSQNSLMKQKPDMVLGFRIRHVYILHGWKEDEKPHRQPTLQRLQTYRTQRVALQYLLGSVNYIRKKRYTCRTVYAWHQWQVHFAVHASFVHSMANAIAIPSNRLFQFFGTRAALPRDYRWKLASVANRYVYRNLTNVHWPCQKKDNDSREPS